jgi:hypothetical protein
MRAVNTLTFGILVSAVPAIRKNVDLLKIEIVPAGGTSAANG